jgi:hypothetical protein
MALQNKKLSVSSQVDSEIQSDVEEDNMRANSVARLKETNKMRRLKDAQNEWVKKHAANSPFRFVEQNETET